MIGLLTSQSIISSGGYLAIFLLCVAQSICVPTSSELTMGFAGVLAATGHLSLAGAIAVGVVGEVIGAYIAWLIGRTGGRAFITKYGRFVLITRTDLERAEGWYQRHQRGGVFIGRLLPVIRGFVAIVAGVAEVPLVSFLVFTTLGSLVWLGAMAGLGYGVGSSWRQITHAFSDAGYVLAAIALLVIGAGVVHRWRSYRHTVHLEGSEAGVAGVPTQAPGTVSPPVSRDRGSRSPQHRRRR